MIENVTLAENDSLKIVKVQHDTIAEWYQAGANYVVDAAHAGVKTIYFKSLSGEIYIEANAPTIETIILYVVNKLGWQQIFAYIWNAVGEYYATWPGIQMTKVSSQAARNRVPAKYAEDDIYQVEISKDYVNIIFTNGTDQTGNLTWQESNPYFVLDGEGLDKGHWQSDSATDVENVLDGTKAVKVLENGQIFIHMGGKIYNVTGQLVK
jgi:hypothetical protein